MRRLWFFLLIFICANIAKANDIQFEFIEQSKGLSSNSVTTIYKDSRGFLWVGTINGLNRYNGKEFVTFSHSANNPQSISNNQITCINEDQKGNIWIGTEKGLNLYDWETEIFTSFINKSTDENSISHNWVKQLFKDSKGNFWAGTREGLNKIILTEENHIYFERYYPERINTENTDNWSIQCIASDNEGEMWIGTWGGGLCHFNPSTGKFTHFLNDEKDRYSITGNIVERIGVIKNGLMLIGVSEEGLCIFDPVKRKFYTQEEFPEYKDLLNIPPPVYTIEYDKKDMLWLGTVKGLIGYSFTQKQIVYESNRKNLYLSTLDAKGNVLDQARTVFIDNTGIVWAGIGKAGLGKYDPGKNKFTRWYIPIRSEEKYRDYLSCMYFENKSSIWYGTAGDGLIRTNINGTTLKRFFFKDINNQPIESVKDICKDVNGFIWLGTENGLIKINPRTEEKIFYLTQKDGDGSSLRHNIVTKLYADDNGLIWIITRFGLQLLDPVQNKIIPHRLDSNLEIDMISSIYKDNQGDYWISGNKKFCLYSPGKEEITYFSGELNNPEGIGFDEITSLYQDRNGIIWIGSKSGLFFIAKEENKPFYFNQVAELSNQIIFHITSDIHNNLWINSSSGIIQYFPQENKILNYNQEAGLTPMIHNIFSTPDGELVILDEKGFYCFNPDSIKGNQHIPPVYFSRININGREIPLASELFQGKNLNTIDRLVLTHEQKVIKIKFDVLNYTLPEKNLYAYKLEGYDTAWIQMGHNNEITLMNLNPGNYTLRVKGANNDNLWNETGKSIKIKVKPPVYKTTYAYLLYILIITGIVVLRQIYQKNRNKLKLKYERQQLEAIKKYELEKLTIQKEHEMDQLKLKFFFDISHEFRTPLTLILAPISTIIKENKFPRLKESHEIIHKNAIHLKNLIDQLLDLRKLEAGKMPPVLVKEKPGLFLNGLKNAFLDYANNRQIVLKTNFQLAESYYNFDKDKIQKIISNLLSNALKFSGNGSEILFSAKILDFESYSQLHQKVQINMKSIIKSINPGKEDQILYINIEDHGKGIPEQDLEKIFLRFYQVPNNFSKPTGTGIGLSLCRELVELLNGSLYIKSQLGMGTLVSLFLPLVPYDGSEQEPIIDTAENQGKNSISNSRVVANKNEEDVNTLNGERKNKKPLILIVEDNEDLLKYLGSFLSEKFLVKKAVNGDEGFVKAQKYIPDLIISDIMMPLVNGYEFCRRIKSEKHLQHIPLIILTAKTGDESVKEFLELGVDDYLVKPFQSEMLQTRIDNLLKKHNQLKTAFKGTSENLPGGITLVNRDEEFIQKAVDLINENLTNADFDKDAFAREMGVSRSQLYKRIIALTGESPNEFVRNIKLKKAAQILKTGTTLQISEIGYMVGFTDPNYFTRKFREYFGTPPREYIMEQKEKE